MDLVYPLGNGATHRDNIDLRYSLRSVELYLNDCDRVFIIGECPKWVQNVIHIPAKDRYSFYTNREANIIHKCVQVFKTDCSENFIFMNDDYFLLKPFSSGDLNFWYKGKLKENGPLTTYKTAKYRTANWLEARGYTSFNYDVHCPSVFNRAVLKERLSRVDWKKNYYVFKSLIYNMGTAKGEEYIDLKLKKIVNKAELFKTLEERLFFSTSDAIMRDGFLQIMESLYPNKSKYEK